MKRLYQFGLIGRNIHYSRSVDIFEAIYDHCGQPGHFELFSIEPTQIHTELRKLSQNGYNAFSVTIPYKQAVISELDKIDIVAQRLQAVNSIAVVSGRLLGYNTDSFGFSLPLKQYADKLRSGHALLLGCGGAAKAVVYALCSDLKMKQVTLIARSPEKIAEFKKSSQSFTGNMTIETLEWSQKRQVYNIKPDIIINCTPLGGFNHPDETPFDSFDDKGFPDCHIYYDLNYNEGNSLIHSAIQRGIIAIDGSAMLVGQAVRSFDIWTGISVPVETIYKRVFDRQFAV